MRHLSSIQINFRYDRRSNSHCNGEVQMPEISIQLNGRALTVPEHTTLEQLLLDNELGERRVAVEINLDIVPRSQHASHTLSDGDRIEVVAAIGGG